ncbi:hypothetical protein GLW03_11360 [Halobacillus halophilus]|nr:hypothetical protein [Halobacillus halophilus]
MASLKGILNEIRNLSTAEQIRLKEYFTKHLTPYDYSEPVFKEVSE